MKKISLVAMSIAGILSLGSCASTMNSGAQKTIRGTWNLDNVSYSEKLVNAKAFDAFDAKCLQNSQWYFVANNNTGSFTLNSSIKGDCPASGSIDTFTWFVGTDNFFNLKITTGDKARKVTTGTMYNIENLTENAFTLYQTINKVKVSYHFTKIADGKLK